MAGHDYNATWRAARSAYESVLQGADRAGVKVTPSYNGWAVLPKVKHKDRHESRNSVVVYGGFDKIGPGSKRAAALERRGAATRRQARDPAVA